MVTLKQHGGKHFRLQQMLWPRGFNAAALQSSTVWHASTELCLPSLSTSYPSLSVSPLLCKSVSLCTCEQWAWGRGGAASQSPWVFFFWCRHEHKERMRWLLIDIYIYLYICIRVTVEESHLLSLTKSASHRCWGDILCTVQVALRSCRTSLWKLCLFFLAWHTYINQECPKSLRQHCNRTIKDASI